MAITLFPDGRIIHSSAVEVSSQKMVDQWRLNTSIAKSSGDFTSNWERNDTDFAYIGSGMSESSGIFTFPATGIYKIDFHMGMYKAYQDVRYMGGFIRLTTDNSSYATRASGYGSVTSSGNSYTNKDLSCIFDVTNTSTHKCKFAADAEYQVSYDGSSTENRTYVTFTRLADT